MTQITPISNTSCFTVRSPPHHTIVQESTWTKLLLLSLPIILFLSNNQNYNFLSSLLDTECVRKILSYYQDKLIIANFENSSHHFKYAILCSIIVLFATTISHGLAPFLFQRKERMVQSQNVCQVEISPLGVQITEYTHYQYRTTIYPRHYPILLFSKKTCKVSATRTITHQNEKYVNQKTLFISRECIIDVIVQEMIQFHKVSNCIMFRISNYNLNNRNSNSIESESSKNYLARNMMKQDYIHLIPAFSPQLIQMTYEECLQVLKGILNVL